MQFPMIPFAFQSFSRRSLHASLVTASVHEHEGRRHIAKNHLSRGLVREVEFMDTDGRRESQKILYCVIERGLILAFV